MKINLALWERILRFMLGVVLATWAFSGGPWWAYFGVYTIMTASWGFCPIYSFFKIRTAKVEENRFIP